MQINVKFNCLINCKTDLVQDIMFHKYLGTINRTSNPLT